MKTNELDVPATIRGWESDGKAKVELLTKSEGAALGQVLVVGVRPDAKGRTASDFSFHNKQGLRLGGTVLMRKLRVDEAGATCRSIEPITMRDSEGATFVMQDAAVYVFRPPPGTAMVKECLVAMLGDAVSARTLSEGCTNIFSQLDAPAVFGSPGLAYFGADKAGNTIDVVIGGESGTMLTPDQMVSAMIKQCPKEVIKDSRTSGTSRPPWKLSPFFRVAVDPDRSSKLSAQALNLAYGTFEDPRWTRGIAVLRTIGNQWHLSDASPLDPSTQPSNLAALPDR
jgi:hypothetical protein